MSDSRKVMFSSKAGESSDSDDAPEDVSFSVSKDNALNNAKQIMHSLQKQKEKERERRRLRDDLQKTQKVFF